MAALSLHCASDIRPVLMIGLSALTRARGGRHRIKSWARSINNDAVCLVGLVGLSCQLKGVKS